MPDFLSVPAITILCYLAAQLYKAFINRNLYKHIPVVCMAAGLILGVASYFASPGFIPAENVIVAAAIGVVSGGAATGVNQMYKKYKA